MMPIDQYNLLRTHSAKQVMKLNETDNQNERRNAKHQNIWEEIKHARERCELYPTWFGLHVRAFTCLNAE